jgi:hypothetical protein
VFDEADIAERDAAEGFTASLVEAHHSSSSATNSRKPRQWAVIEIRSLAKVTDLGARNLIQLTIVVIVCRKLHYDPTPQITKSQEHSPNPSHPARYRCCNAGHSSPGRYTGG